MFVVINDKDILTAKKGYCYLLSLIEDHSNAGNEI